MVKTHFEPEALANDSHQHINRDGDPNLSLHGVVTGPIKRLDSQVLLDPLEKQFRLLTAFIDLGDHQSRQLEVIGEELPSTLVLDVQVADASQRIRISFGRFDGGQDHGVIRAYTGGLVHGMRVASLEQNILFGADNLEQNILFGADNKER